MAARRRLDAELVRRGLAESRSAAARMIDAGVVLVGGSTADKAARLVAADEAVVVSGPAPRFVGRGGEKLAAALDRFGLDPTGRSALDAGSSTGGFTDCLLKAGAARVVAVDVGRHQLHERLRADPRVELHERTDIREFDSGGRRFDPVVADLSFISLRTVAAALVGLAAPGADMILLVKPQFEAGRAEAARARGVIRDPAVWRRALEAVRASMEGAGTAIMGAMVSPIRGADGNVEFLAWFLAPPGGPAAGGSAPGLPRPDPAGVDALIESALAGAAAAGER